LAAVRLPAAEFGPPNRARFSGVSGTGPLVVMATVALAPLPKLLAAGAVVSVEAAPVVVPAVTSVEAAPAAGAGAVDVVAPVLEVVAP
jgi:hypothetical protein